MSGILDKQVVNSTNLVRMSSPTNAVIRTPLNSFRVEETIFGKIQGQNKPEVITITGENRSQSRHTLSVTRKVEDFKSYAKPEPVSLAIQSGARIAVEQRANSIENTITGMSRAPGYAIGPHNLTCFSNLGLSHSVSSSQSSAFALKDPRAFKYGPQL